MLHLQNGLGNQQPEKIRLVIDANILFAALIKTNVTYDILLNKNIVLYAPEFIIHEVKNHKDVILRKNKTNNFKEIFAVLRRRIRIIVEEKYEPFLKVADSISPDPNDSVYFALALYLNIPLWSNDKELKKQKKIKVYDTEEVREMLL